MVKGGRRQGRQRKRWEDNIREWTGLEFGKSQWTCEQVWQVENREKLRKLVAKSSAVPQRPLRLRDWWWWWWNPKRWKEEPMLIYLKLPVHHRSSSQYVSHVHVLLIEGSGGWVSSHKIVLFLNHSFLKRQISWSRTESGSLLHGGFDFRSFLLWVCFSQLNQNFVWWWDLKKKKGL